MSGSVNDRKVSDTGFDIDARESQVLGKPQRIAPLDPKEFDPEAKALVINIRASLGISDNSAIPPVFALMLKHPGLFRCQIEMGIQLLGKGTIRPRERELAIVRVGWLCRAPFEWGEHVDVAKRYDADRSIRRDRLCAELSAHPYCCGQSWTEASVTIRLTVRGSAENTRIQRGEIYT